MVETIQRIICGDNLPVMQAMPAESVDLVYIDPPFFTSKTYEVIWGDSAERRAFEDRWVKAGETGRYSKDINVYLEFMEPRIREIYRILKTTGSFFLHCDWNANSYLRMICDQIFGYKNFRNEIIWCYSGPSQASYGFPRKHDTILRYTKGDIFTFHPIRVPHKSGIHNKGTLHNKVDSTEETDESMRKRETEGKTLEDWWSDIGSGAHISKTERLGYPTQKPEALLERIIKSSSNENDIIMDCFCGCGTSIAVAKRLSRQFIGVDISPTACRLIAKRINMKVKDVEGIPLTQEEVAELSGWEFQNYVIHLLMLHGQGISVGKKGPDGGLDGFFNELPISVKKYKAGRKDLDEFVATLYRNKKQEGMFLALDYTADFVKEVARLKREQDVLVPHFTLTDVLESKHLEILKRYDKTLEKYMKSEL